MDKKPRILVVEDIDTFRESHVDNLEREHYSVRGVGSFAEAHDAIIKRTYHVALVDIMLGGEKDLANRDGVKVLEAIQQLDEGTKPIVVSKQPEKQRVRDFLKNLGAFDYLDKFELEKNGIQLLVRMVSDAVAAGNAKKEPAWADVETALCHGTTEAFFVTDCLGRFQFSGGFEHLTRSLVTVSRHTLPLLVPKGPATAMTFDSALGGFRGRFWSKGQGLAIELIIGDERMAKSDPNECLQRHEKGGLVVEVRPSTDVVYAEFMKPIRSVARSSSDFV